jgi:presenilin-like A22 family membrane protease
MQAFEDPEDPTNSLLYLVLILVATGGMLLAFRLGGERVVRFVVVGTAGLLSWFVFLVVLPAAPAVAGIPVLSLLGALAVVLGLWLHPEWYVIDASGVVMGAGAAGLFGVSFGLLPAVVLLVVLAVYDAVAVYGTEHMLTLAEGVMRLKIPVVLVVPATLSYSYIDAIAAAEDRSEDDAETEPTATADGDGARPASQDERAAEQGPTDGGHEPNADPTDDQDPDPDAIEGDPLARDALFVGLGDAVIPTVLVASAAVYLDAPTLGALPVKAPVAGAMVGTAAGTVALLWLVFRGRAHAGLPLLNGGTIAGYLLAAVAVGVPLPVALGL